MRLIVLGCDSTVELWRRALQKSKIQGELFSSGDLAEKDRESEIRERLRESWDLCVVYGEQDSPAGKLCAALPGNVPVLPVSAEAIALGRGITDPKILEQANGYLLYGGEENYDLLCQYLICWAEGGDLLACPGPRELPFEGLYFPGDVWGETFACWEEYREACREKGLGEPVPSACIGLLSHRGSWIQRDLAVEKILEREFRERGFRLVCGFHSGMPDPAMKNHDLEVLMERFFTDNAVATISGLINLSVWGVQPRQGRSLSQEASRLYRRWNVPVFYPLVSLFSQEPQLSQSTSPLAGEMAWLYLQPEQQGLVEPVLIGCQDGQGGTRVLPERAAHFAARVSRRVRMAFKENREKKVAVILHNAVCSGVEATIGQAYGLDAFSSVAAILRRLRAEGYETGEIPATGEELYRQIRDHKAMSDFRWTAVEDIVAAGGCLYQMDCQQEYLPYFQELAPQVAQKMEKTWGPPPGEGMVLNEKLIISGLRFENVLVMVQPKRGCHKAKCTGEVCKILHDPQCPPPHQYLATYRYIQDIFRGDCCIHVGTEGSLEYLPGNSNGLTGNCWPDIVLGELPNFYLYHAGIPAEAAVAKRRSYAVLLGYLPMAAGCQETYRELSDDIDRYRAACQLDNGQEQRWRKKIQTRLESLEEARKIVETEADLLEGLSQLQRYIRRLAETADSGELHVFGSVPRPSVCLQYVEEVWDGDEEIHSLFPQEDSLKRRAQMARRIKEAWEKERPEDLLDYSAVEILRGLKGCTDEMDHLVNVLDGRYLPPGECGMPDENGVSVLPTGRNLYQSDVEHIPTAVAWERGKELADQLVDLYRQEEGELPRKVAMNMMSLDITRSKGEQLSQFLYLMGISPVWDQRGRVTGLRALPLEELGRPRIDVTVRITGVLRDSWPEVVELMDEGVFLAASQEESDQENFVRSNMKEMNSTLRIFGDAPGTYGAGVDLALLASAWESEEDLMRYYIQHSAYAYGRNLHGETRVREFVENVKEVDLSYGVTDSKRMDVMSCGFGTQVQGGMRLMAKYLGKKKIRQYQGVSLRGQSVELEALGERYRKTVETTLLNGLWREGKKRQGYHGAADVMFCLQNLFMDQCLSELLPDWLIDQVVEECLNAEDMQKFFREENPHALEESARRFLEMNQRGKWKGEEAVLSRLQETYLEAEGDVECGLDSLGEIQGGGVEVQNDSQVEAWGERLREVDRVIAPYLSEN